MNSKNTSTAETFSPTSLKTTAPKPITQEQEKSFQQNPKSFTEKYVARPEYIKPVLIFTAWSTLLVLYFAIVISGHPASGLLLNGTLLSTAIGVILGSLPLWANQRHADGKSAIVPLVFSGVTASIVTVLYHILLNPLFKEAVFYSTLGVGTVVGSLLALNYWYVKTILDSKKEK